MGRMNHGEDESWEGLIMGRINHGED